MLIKILGGFLMALADSVPGVSGGTVAFLMGIYDGFINSLNDIVSKDKEKRKKAISFLIKLGIGWVSGMALAAIVINAVLSKNIYEISSLFMGFVFFAIPLIAYEERDSLKGKYQYIIFTILGIAVVSCVTYFSKQSIMGGVDLSWGNFSAGTGVYLFFCAMLAISAMVLPGISGSTLMLIFGIYEAVMGAIHGFLTMDFSYVPALFIFGFGVIAGICSVVKLLKIGLEKHRPQMIYLIIGLMLGSFYAIVRGPESLKESPRPAMTFSTFNVVFFIIGGAVIIGLQVLKYYMDNKSKEK